jgi:transcriptional regulator of acetoin/glycerol metabolism
VRELENIIERSALLSGAGVLNKVYLPHRITRAATTLVEVERQHILEIIRRCRGKIAGKGGAAELLDIPASTLNSKMKKLGIARSLTIE